MVHQTQGQLVQELATGGLPAPPSRYVLREKDRPTDVSAAPELQFPTVDVRRLANPGDTDEAAKLRAALQSWGLFAVRMHSSTTIYMFPTHTYTPSKSTQIIR